MPSRDDLNCTLCQLLLWHRDGYEPPETMLQGYAAMAFMRMGQGNFMYFTSGQMEQMAAVLALANICVQGEEPSTCDVLFALLEGDIMYLEVLAQTLYWTGFIGPEDSCKNDNAFYNCPPTKLMPDQEERAYIRVMKEGPLLLLHEMTKYKLGMALFAALKKQCQFYHLLVQRLLRLAAREALKTKDGKALGKMARLILGDGILGVNVAAISKNAASDILENAVAVLTSPEAATNEAIKGLLEIP